jgi:hypothetical protein
VESSKVELGSRDERSESGHEIQRLQHPVGRAVPEWVFVLVDEVAVGAEFIVNGLAKTNVDMVRAKIKNIPGRSEL